MGMFFAFGLGHGGCDLIRVRRGVYRRDAIHFRIGSVIRIGRF